jgi:GABA permease
MPWTTKLLVIANRTIDTDAICDTIIGRAAAGPLEVMLVAPASSGAGPQEARRMATAARLDRAVRRLTDAGIPVEGVVGDPDPMIAVQEAWDPRRFDEVIVATLPTRSSRWLAADLPRRVERFTGARVTHVVAAGDHAHSRR